MSRNKTQTQFVCRELQGTSYAQFHFRVSRLAAVIPLNSSFPVVNARERVYEAWFKNDSMPALLLLDIMDLRRAAPWLLRFEIVNPGPDGKPLGRMLIEAGHRVWQTDAKIAGCSWLRVGLPRKRQTLTVRGSVASHWPQNPEILERSLSRTRPVIDTAKAPVWGRH